MKREIISIITPHHATSGSIYHRIVAPHKYLEKQYGVRWNPCLGLNFTDWRSNKADVVLFNSYITLPMGEDGDHSNIYAVVEELRKYGKKIVLDIDDLWSIPPHHPDIEYFNKVGFSRAVEISIELADAVITTTSYLASKISMINKNVVILPNFISPIEKQYSKYKAENRYDVGYFGGVSHYMDLFVNQSILEGVLEGRTILFPSVFEDATSNKMFEILNMYGKCTRVPFKSVYDYAEYYKQVDCSLSILEDSEFNRAKSNLKYIEAQATNTELIEIGMKLDKEIPCPKETTRIRYRFFKEL